MENILALIYVLVSFVTDFTLVGMINNYFLVLIIVIQVIMLSLFIRWNLKGKRMEISTLEEIDKYFMENAIIAVRIVFLIINIPLMVIILSWKVDLFVCSIEIILFVMIYVFEEYKKIKFFASSHMGIQILLKGYAISGLIATTMYIVDLIFNESLGLLSLRFNVYWQLASLNISFIMSIILLCRNKRILSWICNNYKKDPIMLENYNKTQENK